MSIDADQPTHETAPPTQSGRRRNLLALVGGFVVVVVAGAAILLATGDGDDLAAGGNDPAAVVADYLEVWNAEDAEAVMVFYTEDAVLDGHPSDPDGLATGHSEILAVERTINGFQGAGGSMEYINMEVSGDTVTFDNIFINREGQCFSSAGSVMTVEGDKIARVVWGDTDADLCP